MSGFLFRSFLLVASNFDNLDIKVSFDISSLGIHRIFPLVNYMNLFIGSGAISPISFIFSPCLLPFFTKNDHILMHPFMCARIIHHLVVVGHILHNFTSAQNLNTYKNILHDFVHKLWLFCLVPSKIFCYCCQFESDVEAEFIDLIEYTAKICNKDDIACGVALKL